MSDEEDEPAELAFAGDTGLDEEDGFVDEADSANAPAAKRPRGAAPKGKDGTKLIWDDTLGSWVEAGYEGESHELTEAWMKTRHAQTMLNLEKCAKEGGVFGAALITHDEVRFAEKGLLNALRAIAADPRGAKQEETASAAFWAIACVWP